tara:strand:- start:178 stop:420 length:243 start_codon:yes stop_codon:yes gene_type:complete
MRDKKEIINTYGTAFAGFVNSHLTPKENFGQLVCDICNRQDGAKSDWAKWEGTINVHSWGNEHDHGTICDECQEDVNDNQ